ncbi:two-component regulator propeller domain-containing protein [Tahibacter amnicola]|uniref:histidine kinase n=1 Tax=Tahibacter amnicola TaxID=2976241 RepID=A0ABY6BKM0_9GAMM|nr:two-component regulator propeller domain-containing protein [Tahibacter amnicola]UXI69958.1 ATP-binding protein [Tahibacter amnicola]
MSFRTYGSSQGLANPGVVQLVQDAAGFLWVGTENGLYRYDGHRFDAYGIREGLPSSQVDALKIDTSGLLWVGTHAGLAQWNGSGFSAINDVPGVTGMQVNDLAANSEGLWIATAEGLTHGVAQTAFRRATGWPAGEATALWSGARSGTIWAGWWNNSARVLAWKEGRWISYEAPPEHALERIDGLFEDDAGRTWARTSRSIWMLSHPGARFEPQKAPIPLFSNSGYFSPGNHGDFWIPTGQGIAHFDHDRWNVIDEAHGLPTNWARTVLQDREGSVWIGALGLLRIAGRGVVQSYTKSDGLPDNVVWQILRDRNDTLWIGTAHGLARFDGRQWITVTDTRANAIRSLLEAPDGTFYMAGIPANEVIRFRPPDGPVERIPLSPEAPAKRIFRLVLDDEGVLWASTDGAGLFSADTRTGTPQFRQVALPGGNNKEYISDLHRDAAGRLWAAGQFGLAVRHEGTWHRFTRADGLRRDHVAYVRALGNGNLLFAYFDPVGAAEARYESGSLKMLRHFASDTTHTPDKIFIVGEDAHRRLWFGGGEGIDLVSPYGTEHFGIAEGMPGEDCAAMAFLAEPNGDVWIGTSAGLARFDGSAHAKLPVAVAPPPVFVGLRLGTSPITPGGAPVRVPATQSHFEARFAAPSFVRDGTLQYRVRLHGLEEDPHVSDNRDVRYPALPAGDYRLEVAARISPAGAWGPSRSFEFTVLPPWWQTWWFRLLLGLSAVLVVLLGVQWRVAALHRRNRLLEEHVEHRTRELSVAHQRQSEALEALNQANDQLLTEINERLSAERAVQQRNVELETVNRKLAGTQTQLLQSEKMASVGQLAAGVAHEINTPIGYVQANLGSLRLYAENMSTLLAAYATLEKAQYADTPEYRNLQALRRDLDMDFVLADTAKLIDESQDGLQRIAQIVRDLRDFSRIDVHPGMPEWQAMDVRTGLESTLNILAHAIRDRVEVVREFGDVPLITAIPFQINQVFLAILVNALQAISGRGRVTVRTSVDGARVRVDLCDTGVGIDPAHLGRIFEPFFSTRPVGAGTGLGLSVAWSIVERHGGTIQVVSEPGHGSCFAVFLPIHPPARRNSPDGSLMH